MSDTSVKPRGILPAPGWSLRWFVGAALFGLILPALLAAMISLAGYYPIGTALPSQFPWGSFGIILAILRVSATLICTVPVYCLLAWNWRPLGLGLIFGVSVAVGFVPGTMVVQYLQKVAFDLFSQRSAEVVAAIERYSRVNGAPPATLAALVPNYLPAILRTGMAADPDYRYEPSSGPCSEGNQWHLSVSVTQFLDLNRLLYCPLQDYGPAIWPVMSRTKIGTWVHDEVDF